MTAIRPTYAIAMAAATDAGNAAMRQGGRIAWSPEDREATHAVITKLFGETEPCKAAGFDGRKS